MDIERLLKKLLIQVAGESCSSSISLGVFDGQPSFAVANHGLIRVNGDDDADEGLERGILLLRGYFICQLR